MSGIDLQDLRKTGGIIKLQGKEFITFSGLLVTAHSNGIESIIPKLLTWDVQSQSAVFSATVTGSRGTYTAHGDADPHNVKKGMQGAILRMAETRSVCRALRMYLGIGMTAREELPGDAPERQKQPRFKIKIDRFTKAEPENEGAPPAPIEGFRKSVEELGVKWSDLVAFAAAQQWDDLSTWSRDNLVKLFGDIKAGNIEGITPKDGAA